MNATKDTPKKEEQIFYVSFTATEKARLRKACKKAGMTEEAFIVQAANEKLSELAEREEREERKKEENK